MQKIKILPESLINKIAAGEVVERPASVVKELVENAIDAGSDQIFITIRNGGRDFISVLDNGCGMSAEDAKLAIERHATSKILCAEDLENIQTMGFRGEALAAIAAVSRFELTTCGDESEGGFQVRVEGGKLIHSARLGFPRGTRIVVENLFFNTPARQKFMKSANTEHSHIHSLILQLALGHPAVQFRLIHNKNIILNMPKGQDFSQRVQYCFGSEITQDLVDCSHQEPYLSFSGLVSLPSGVRASKRWQHVFVNDRYVKSKPIAHAVYEGYKTLLRKNMHPLFFLKLTLSPQEIDVDVHPAKTEIRLRNPNLIHTILSEQIARLLKEHSRQSVNPVWTALPEPEEPVIDLDLEYETLPSDEADDELPTAPNPASPVDIEPASKTSAPEYQPVLPARHAVKQAHFVEPNEQINYLAPESSPQRSSSPPIRRTEKPGRVPQRAESNSEPFSFSADHGPRTQPPVVFAAESTLQAIGQLSNKYILAQGNNSLVLVDQHAAHERIRFEEIRRQFYAKALVTQALLIPIMLQLPPQDGLLLEQHQASWKKLGFVIDHFGGNDYSIKEIPAIIENCDVPAIIRDVLDEMAQFGRSGKLELFFNEVFERMACHSAIRASQKLAPQEMQALLNQLSALDLQLHCPHGRPIIVEIPLEELDKRFKR